MKRFYKQAGVVAAEGGWQVTLDGRPVRTPAKAALTVPTRPLADAIAAEWAGQGEEIDPVTMQATGLANAAIDQIAPNRESFAAGIAAYGETDLLCYRAAGPAELVARQAAEWDPLLDWARMRYDIAFRVTTGIVHIAQPPESVARLAAAVTACTPMTLAGLSTLVTISGSLVIGLALLERAFPLDPLWRAAELDSLWQAQLWGADEAAEALRARRRIEFEGAARFCALAAADDFTATRSS